MSSKNLFIIVCCFAMHVSAQSEMDTTVLRVSYDSKMRYTEDGKNLSDDEKVLDIGKHSSHFYSRWSECNKAISDSIFGRGGTVQDNRSELEKTGFPDSETPFHVFKNYPKKGLLTYTDKVFKSFIYEEPMEMPDWKLSEGDTVVLGYHCKKAQTTFRGRTWNVWYTMDIPYSDGPWKLYGLPGLILHAADAKGDFIFDCIGIKQGNMGPIVLRKEKYINCTPQEFEKNRRSSFEDPDSYMTKMGFPNIQGYDAKGRPIVHKPQVPCLLEYVLKNYKK